MKSGKAGIQADDIIEMVNEHIGQPLEECYQTFIESEELSITVKRFVLEH